MRLWRIVTGPHPVWSGEGARLFGSRWNALGQPAIYAGTSFAICLLEVLVHANRKSAPSAARFVEVLVPDDVSRERFDARANPGWDNPHLVLIAQAFGSKWLASGRSALLIVPSVVTAGRDDNVVLNPQHPGAEKLSISDERPVAFDPRLFG